MPDNKNIDPTKNPTNVLGQLIAAQLKEVEKLGKQQVQEAVQQGVPLESIANTIQDKLQQPEVGLEPPGTQDVGRNLAGQTQQPSQELTAIQQRAAELVAEPNNPIAKLLRSAGFGKITRAQELENLQSAQQILGRQPLQKGEREKLKILAKQELDKLNSSAESKRTEKIDKFFDKLLNPEAPSTEQGKVLSLIETSLNAVDTMNNILGIEFDTKTGEVKINNLDKLRDQNFLSENRQQLIRARDVFINKMLRRDTGAAIGKEEEKQFKKIYGFDVGVKSFFKQPQVIAQALAEAKNQLTRDRNRLLPNEQRNNEIKKLLKMGFKKEDIFAEYENRGEL